jgi:hypothetical protein
VKRKLLIFTLCFLGIGIWVNLAEAGDTGYRFRPSKFNLKSDALPRSGIVFFDAVVGRPVGLATTIAGTGIYLATLPMTLPTGSAGEAGWELVARPGGWTFVRPIAEKDERFDEKGLTEGP